MDIIEQLYIRACRSKNPSKRLVTLHNRLYLQSGYSQRERNVIYDLSNIIDKYCPSSTVDFISGMHSIMTEDKLSGRERTFNEHLTYILYSRIRFTELSNFEGLTSPCRFK